MLDPKRLRSFVTVAEELHFGRAAERLHIAQPPLTRQISLLETELGFQLFARTSRKVMLTPAGLQFLPYARSVVEFHLRATEFARRLAEGMPVPVTFGYSPSICLEDRFTASIRAVGEEFPGVKWTFVELPSKALNEAVANGRIDVAVSRIRPPQDARGIVLENRISERLVVALPENDALCKRASVSPDSLQDKHIILSAAGAASGLNAQLHTLFDCWNVRARLGPTAPHLASVLALVAANLGIALVPESAAASPRLGVQYRPLEGESGYLDAYVVRKEEKLSGAAEWLLQAIAGYFGSGQFAVVQPDEEAELAGERVCE
ncbi:LysR family transcriptional regulator [Burkholderia ubonensis]|uniref:LysR family transcriptional regulator n=1 Tax=Burkholderia ubonensis TaxID=101571 RepID=UPI00075AE56B|nr:LysR substrate-binding domain-containing protein [Burkholderia ubonensis]AYZ64677.1 LysR family transcriptional regulator [Burkholderia multivorans]KVD96987.1 hypothetical protein WI90_33255 [Burkholderia ubonensis]VWB42537.1 LysR family transcriptional regulator [Burkholderia ubonensis]